MQIYIRNIKYKVALKLAKKNKNSYMSTTNSSYKKLHLLVKK